MTRDQKQLVRAALIEVGIMCAASKISETAGGWIGLLIWLFAVSLHSMFIYYDYRREQAYKAERRKVKEFAGALSSAYERNDKK